MKRQIFLIRMRAWVAPIVMLGVLGAAVCAAKAAEPQFVGSLALAVEETTARQLGLSEEVQGKLRELIEEREKAAVPLALEIKDLPPEERERRLAPFVAETERMGMEWLTLEQRSKLNQLRLQRNGMSTLNRPEMVRMLELTEDQQDEIQRLLDERDAAMTRGGEVAQRSTRASYEGRLRTVLTDRQRATWEQMAGLGPGLVTEDEPETAEVANAEETTRPDQNSGEMSGGVQIANSESESVQADTGESQAEKTPREEPGKQDTEQEEDALVGVDEAGPDDGKRSAGMEKPGESETATEPPLGTEKTASAATADLPEVSAADTLSSEARTTDPYPPSEADKEKAQPTEESEPASSPTDAPVPAAGDPATVEKSDRHERTAANDTQVDREKIKLRFNFRYQPWEDVLDWLAEQADLSLQSNIIPEGTFNYTDTRSYTPTEAIDLINGVLWQQGYTLVRRGRMLSVMDLEQEIPEVLVEFVPVEQLDERGRFELVKTVFHLARMAPAAVEEEIGQLLGPGQEMVVMPQARQLLVTGTAGKLRMIRDVIEQAESPSEEDGALTEIKLEHITAEEVLKPARALLGLEEGQNVGEDISIAQDASGTRLFVHGEREKIELLTDLVERVDQEREISPAAMALEQPQLRTHSIETADSAEALAVLQTLLAGLPDVRMSLDPNTNKIIALARPSEHKTIEETIKQLEGEAPQLQVIQLKRIDPRMAVVAIDNFFSNPSEDEPSTIKIDADPSTMRLYVRATPSEVEQIQELIDQLESPAVGSSEQTLRFIPLGNRGAAESAVETARRMWLGPNRIELITPSDSGSSIFDLKEVNPEPAEDPLFQSPRGRSGPRATPSRRLKEPAEAASDVGRRDKVTFQRSYRRINGVSVQFASLNQQEEEDSLPENQPPEAHGEALDAQQRNGAVNEADLPRNQSGIPSRLQRNEPTDSAEAGGGEGSEAAAKQDADEPSPAPKAESESGKESDIRVELTPEGVLIASEDTEALDRFEALLRQLTGPQTLTPERDFTVYFLKYSRAEVARQLISDILGGSTSGLGGTSLAGDLASSLLGGGGGILGTLLGSSGGGEQGNAVTTVQAAGPVSIVADARLNCLVVQAMPADLKLIEQLLKVIDREGSITDVQTTGKPHIIPIIYLNAEDVATVVKEAYADRIAQAGRENQRGGRPDPAELIRALRGGGGGRGGGGDGGNRVVSEAPKMSIAVDVASNSLIVTAAEPLFKEVEELVYQIDQASSELTEDVVVVSLKSANPEAVQQALASVMNGSSNRSSNSGNANRSAPNARNSAGGNAAGDMRARIEAFRRMREAMGGGGRPAGGNAGRGAPQLRGGGGRPGGGRGR